MVFVRRDERLADAAPHFLAHRNVLQVRIGRRETPRCRHGLIERGVDASCRRVDQLGQCFDVGRQQFLHSAVFQDQIHDPVFVGERLEIFFVGAELFRFRHLGLLGDAHLAEKHFAQLTRRVDVERCFARLCADFVLQLGQAAAQFHIVFRQRCGVDPHARHFDVGQHLDHRFFDTEIEVAQPHLLHHRIEFLFELQRHVRIFGCILLYPFDVYQVHGQLLRAFADEGFDLDGPVLQIAFGQGVHVVARFGIEQIVEDHRVVFPAAHRDAQTAEHHVVEFDVLPDFGDRLVFEKRLYDRRQFGRVFFPKRDVPRLVGFHGQRQSYDAVVEDVESRSLRVEAEFGIAFYFGYRVAQLSGCLYQRVGVRCVEGRTESRCGRSDRFGLCSRLGGRCPVRRSFCCRGRGRCE